MRKYQGIAASSGIGRGKSFCYSQSHFELKEDYGHDILKEHSVLNRAFDQVKKDINHTIEETRQHIGQEEAAIFEAHLMMTEDPEILDAISEKINDGRSAFNATFLTFDEFAEIFGNMESEYMRERAKDLKDIKNRVLSKMEGKEQVDLRKLPENTILMADDLLPSDTAMLNPSNVKGFITKSGGKTSHIAIMARTLGIPAIVGVQGLPMEEGLSVVMNGENGTLILSPDEETLAEYELLHQKEMEEKKTTQQFAAASTMTKSGKHFEIAANIGSPKDIDAALAVGAEGIGLFRTEFLFMDRTAPPTEEEQYEAYSKVLSAFPNHKVVIRTLDIGGDKYIPYMDFPEEMNPFLGYRAIRYCLDHKDLFQTQLRALLRASVHGKLSIMIPMIATLEEILASRELYQQVQADLKKENIIFSDTIEFGIMIEVPHAAMMSDILADHVDFFSIGTNDLIQYTIAADRLNPKLSNLYSHYQPGVLRLIDKVVKSAKEKGIWVGMCGEAAADVTLLPLWLSLGFDELSMSSSSVLKARALAAGLDENQLSYLSEEIMRAKTTNEVEKLLRGVNSL